MDGLALGFRHNQGEEQLGNKVLKRSRKERPLHPCFNSCQLHGHAEETLNVWNSVRSSTRGTGNSVR